MKNNDFSDADIMQAISEVDGRIATQTYHTKKDRQEAMNITTAYGFPSIVNGERRRHSEHQVIHTSYSQSLKTTWAT